MTYFKRCFVALFTLIILCFCCSCGINNKAAGMYEWDDGWGSYVVVNKDGTYKVYSEAIDFARPHYNLTMSGKYEIKGDKVKVSLDNILNTGISEEFIFKRNGQDIVLYGQLSGEEIPLSPVDSKGFTFSEGLDEMYAPATTNAGENTNSVNEATKVTPSINIADDTTGNIDDDYVSPLTSNFTLEMGTDYPVYKSKVAVPEAYIHPDYFSQEIADSIFLAYQDFLFDEVLNNENKSWIDDCEYDWYITSCGAGVYTISFNFPVPSKEYTSLSYETNSTLTFDEYGYYEVSNFALECTG